MGPFKELTSHQLCRLAVCARVFHKIKKPFCVLDIFEELEMERTHVGRFLRLMSKLGYLKRVKAPRDCVQPRAAYYVMTPMLNSLRVLLKLQGREPGVCCVCGVQNIIPYPWRKRFFCRKCLMEAKRVNFPKIR